MATTNSRSRAAVIYGQKLRTALEQTGTSIYRLSRILNPAQPESARSNIQRYLAGRVLPGIESRHELADALARPELLSVPDEDEERSPVTDLMDALRRVVQDELSKERVALSTRSDEGSGGTVCSRGGAVDSQVVWSDPVPAPPVPFREAPFAAEGEALTTASPAPPVDSAQAVA